MTENQTRPVQEREPVVQFVHTTDFPEILRQLRLSLIVTTYQAQRVLLFSPKQERLFMLMREFERPTGMVVDGRRLALCAKSQVWLFEDAGEVRDLEGNVMPHDVVYAPRQSYVTGDIAAHEMVYHRDQLLIVNTRFSCLCTLSPQWSFVRSWCPPFISACVPEDRCHLNGLAVDENGPKYVTALGETDVKEGWRENKVDGGCIVDVPTGEVVSRGLSMPHSPRLYRGVLWVLDSGNGALQVVDAADGKRTTVASFKGYLRGLDFYGDYAFVGLSRIREKKTFGGVPLEQMHNEFECAVYMVNINTGQTTGFIQFTKGIEELFAVSVLAGFTQPHMIGFKDDTVDGLFVLNPADAG